MSLLATAQQTDQVFRQYTHHTKPQMTSDDFLLCSKELMRAPQLQCFHIRTKQSSRAASEGWVGRSSSQGLRHLPHHRPRQLKHLGILAEAQQRIAPPQLIRPHFAHFDTLCTFPNTTTHTHIQNGASILHRRQLQDVCLQETSERWLCKALKTDQTTGTAPSSPSRRLSST